MPEELITTQIVATQVVVSEGKVDQAPQITPEIQAEMDRLKTEKEELEKQIKKEKGDVDYWIDRKKRERNEYYQKHDYIRSQGSGTIEPPAPIVVQPVVEAQPPRREDFDDYDKYVEALVEHRTEAKISTWRKEDSEKKGKSEYQERMDDLGRKLEEGAKSHSDFDEVVRDPSATFFTPLLIDIMAELENPADVAYFLGKNRTEGFRISHLTPFKAHREMMRIEAEVLKAKPTVKVVSGAPAPIKPVGSGDSLPQKDISKMSQKEYEAYAKEKGMRQF